MIAGLEQECSPVNGLQPYESWSRFPADDQERVEPSTATRSRGDIPGPITELLLKYVNLFDADLLEGRGALSFCKDTAGIRMDFPPAMTSLFGKDAAAQLNMVLGVPLAWGAHLRFGIGDGSIVDSLGQSRKGVVMDTTISVKDDLPLDVKGAPQLFRPRTFRHTIDV